MIEWIIGGTILSGIANALEGDSKRSDAARRTELARNYLQSAIIDSDELDLMLANTERLFNNRLVNSLNTTALRGRGVANRGVLGAAVTGNMESAKLQTMENTRAKIVEHNTQIGSQLAQLELGDTSKSGNFTSDFMTGAVGGLPAAMELGQYFNQPDFSLPTKDIGSTSSKGKVIDTANVPDRYRYDNEEDMNTTLFNTIKYFN